MCKCGCENNKNAKFCSNCGISLKNNDYSHKFIPKIITVKDAYEQVFNKKICLTKIYDLVRTKSLPHCNANGKILLDTDKTIEWWNKKLEESMEPINSLNLHKVI